MTFTASSSTRTRTAPAMQKSSGSRLQKPRRNTDPNLTLCLKEGLVATSLDSMRHAYHQRGMVYMNGETSTASFRPRPTTPDQKIEYSFGFEPEKFVILFTRYIETDQSFLRLEECHCRRGEAHLYVGATELAMRDFEKALTKNPEMAEAYHGRGNAYRQQGMTDRAMADLEEALRLKSELPNALIDRGNLYLQTGSLAEATRDYDTAISMMRMGAFRGHAELGDGYFSGLWPDVSSKTGAEPRPHLNRQRRKACCSRLLSEASVAAWPSSKPNMATECLPTSPPCCT